MSGKLNKKKLIIILSIAVAVVAAVVLVVCLCFCRHDYKQEILKAATCTDSGVAKIACSKCGDIKSTEEIPALGHNVVKNSAVLPTHYADGVTESESCSRCGAVIKAAEKVNRLSYIVLCLEAESDILGADGKVNFVIDGLSPIYAGLAADDGLKEFGSLIDSLDESKCNGGYAVFEAPIDRKLTARVLADGKFAVRWNVDDSVLSQTDYMSVTVPENDMIVYVSFKRIYSVKVTSEPESFVPKIESDGQAEGGFYEDSIITLTAEEVEGYKFYGWFKNGNEYGNREQVIEETVTADAEYKAIYKKISKLSVNVKGEGGNVFITLPGDETNGDTTIEATEERTYYLHAVAAEGYEFDGWYDGETLLEKEADFYYLMGNSDKVITAKFKLK